MLRLALSRQGWQVDVVGDGLEAVERAVPGEYDLILMDHWMPKCAGLEATQRIVALTPGQRMAMATGSPTDKGLRGIVAKEGLYQLTKPFNAKQLEAPLRGWLKGLGKLLPVDCCRQWAGEANCESPRALMLPTLGEITYNDTDVSY